MAGRELGCYGDAALLYRCQSVAVRRGMVILLPYSLREKSPAGCAKLSAGGYLATGNQIVSVSGHTVLYICRSMNLASLCTITGNSMKIRLGVLLLFSHFV